MARATRSAIERTISRATRCAMERAMARAMTRVTPYAMDGGCMQLKNIK